MFYLGSTLLHRSERLDWLRKDPERYLWWLDLRSMAAEALTYVSVGKSRVEAELHFGQIATTYQDLAYEWRVSDKTAKKFLNLMEKSQRIEVEEKDSYVLITIKHYAHYCCRKDSRGQSQQNQIEVFYPEVEMDFDDDESGLQTPTIFPKVASSTTIIETTNSTIATSTNTSLEQDLKFFEKLKSCKKILDEIAKQNHLPNSETVVEELEKFMSYNERKKRYHKSYDDFLDHIYRWFFTVYGLAIARGKISGKETGAPEAAKQTTVRKKGKVKKQTTPVTEEAAAEGENLLNDEIIELFDQFRRAFPGTKRGLDAELGNLKKKYRNWRELVPLFMPALEKALAWRQEMTDTGQFVPAWPYLRTWINDRRWENEYQPVEHPKERLSPETSQVDSDLSHKDEDYGGSFGGAE